MIKYIENFRINYKTELCRNWVTTGSCEFDQDCAYAHGLDELQSKTVINKNYKTKMCKKFHFETPGICKYGDKCQFIHSERHSVIPQTEVATFNTQSKFVVGAQEFKPKPLANMSRINRYRSQFRLYQ